MKMWKPLQIFLLHARSDQNAVHALYERLCAEGANVWLDQQRLLPGDDWKYEIRKAIHASDLVIACISRQFNRQGGYRHEELSIALEVALKLETNRAFIIPARLEACDLPEPLRRWQRVDLFAPDGYEKLVGALQHFACLQTASLDKPDFSAILSV